jgi:hypothetical protein
MGDNYYDYQVMLMDTDTDFEKRSKGIEKQYPSEFIAKNHFGEIFALEGLYGVPLNQSDIEPLFDGCDGGCPILASVEDNGEGGDGLRLEFTPISRDDRFCTEGIVKEPFSIFGIRLKPEQAKVLAAALLGAANMREAQEKK